MQIVIDIPDEYKKHFDENRCKEKFDSLATNEFGYILRKAFENGTPLPKGHGRLIDCDLLQNAMYDLCDEAGTLKDNPWIENPHIDAITDVISFAPTIIGADKEGSESE